MTDVTSNNTYFIKSSVSDQPRMNDVCIDKSIMTYRLYINDICVGYCHYFFIEVNLLYISDLHVEESYRHKGFGTRILYKVLFDAYVLCNARYAYLIDATDRYRCPNNIYTKMGFTYKQVNDDNDMIGNLRHILYGRTQLTCGRPGSNAFLDNNTPCIISEHKILKIE